MGNSSSKNLCCFWARTVSQRLTLGSVLREVDVLRKSMPSDKPCPRPLWLTIKNLWMNRASKPSRTCWSNSTELFWSLILVGANPRNSVVPEPGQDSKSPTVNSPVAKAASGSDSAHLETPQFEEEV